MRQERDNQRRDLSGMLAAVRTAYVGDRDACEKFMRSLED